MKYAYIRVSTETQTVENQRFEIQNYANKNGFKISRWVAETKSGTIKPEKRKLGELMQKVKKGDIIIVSELSRLSRSMVTILDVLQFFLENGVGVISVKEGYNLTDDITSKVLAFAFGLSAEIERTLISQRTKESLKRKRAEGVKLGRPKGRKSSHYKLTGKERSVKIMLNKGYSVRALSIKYEVSWSTMNKFIKKLYVNN